MTALPGLIAAAQQMLAGGGRGHWHTGRMNAPSAAMLSTAADLDGPATAPAARLRGKVLSVNVGRAQKLRVGDRTVLTAIGKRAVAQAVEVRPLGLAGDEQVDLTVHGGLAKAVYAYPSEHYAFWRRARALDQVSLFDELIEEDLPWGSLGENLTLSGLLETRLWVGDYLVFARCVLRVTEPRQPCGKFTASLGLPTAAKLMAQEANCGSYLAVDQAGLIEAGEHFELVPGARQQSLVGLFRAQLKPARLR
jgi:MOSC domain-containing protein YiiM